MTKILIVDDKTENLYLLQSMLDTNGYKTISAKNGAEALGLMRNNIPDLIISDILMPLMDGFTLCRECKKDEVLKDIPFFFYTATYTDAKDEEYALGLGADRFILKPQEPDVFLQIISDFMAEVKKKNIHPKKNIQKDESVVLKEYNEVLIRKIEDKMLQTEKSEKELRNYAEKLEKEINEHKKSEESLRKSEEYNRLLFNSSPIGLALCKMDGSLVDINPAFAQIIGRTIEDTLKLTYWDITPEKYASQEAEQIKILEETGRYGTYEKEYIHKDGHLVPVLLQGLILEREGEQFIWSSVEDITERKHAEEALVESETKYRQLVTQSPDGIFITDFSGKFLSVNRAICENLKYREEEFLTLNVQDIVPEQYHSLYKERLGNILNGESTNTYAEYEIKGKEGITFFVEVISVPYYKGKEIIGFQGIARDITERKKAEVNLRSSEERLKILFDYAPDAYYLNDLKGNFIDGNIAAEKLLGHDRNELIGKNFLKLNLLSLEQIPKAVKLLINNSLGQGTGPDEFVIRRKDGSKVTVEIITHPVKIEDKTLVLGMARDITERKRAEETIIHERKMLRTLIDNLPDMIYVKDTDCRKVVANKADVRYIGFKEETKVLGKTDIELFPGPIGESGYAEDKMVITTGKEIKEFEYNYIDSKGVRRWLLTTKIPLHDKGGKISGLVGIGHEITERKLAEEELIKAKDKAEESDRLKTAFLHNISHEVRTPMNAIVGFSDLILNRDLPKETFNSFLETIVQNSNQLLFIINQIINMATIEAGQLKMYDKEISLNSIFKTVFEQFNSQAYKKSISLKYYTMLPDHDDKIITDETKLTQVITNLVSNSLKFTKQGSISFGYSIKDNFLEFYFKDTGIGIPSEMHEEIFNHFRQVETSMAREFGGQGLGLSISKAYIERLGGKIWLTSKPGAGSEFYFTLPYNKVGVDKLSENKIEGKKKPVLEKAITLLVAEDEDDNFMLISEYLSNINIVVLRAANGIEAVEICKNNEQINLILMDLKMPEMDGFEATRIIKESRPDLPVIAQTAYVRDVDKTKALDCGCSDFISKPFRKDALLAKIREYMILD